MEVELPEWLDATFLASALQGKEEGAPEVTVKHFSAVLAVAAGNNYLSRLYRVRVEHVVQDEDKCTSLIVKVPFTQGVMNEISDQCDFYSKEPNVYKELLPILDSTIRCEFGPLYYSNSVNNVIVLSDLKELGFEMCDRYEQLDFLHCELVLRTLAKFHAASVVCIKDYPDIVDLVGKESIYTQSEIFETKVKPWLQGSLKMVVGLANDMKLNKASHELILSRVDDIADSVIGLIKPKTAGLNVMNHGDLWSSNILFKHSSSGSVVDIRFIDYQIVRYGSPVLDIIYFLWSSANVDVRESRLKELVEIYRTTLNKTLDELGSDERLTKEELFEDIKAALDWVLVIISTLLPVTLCDAGDVIDVEHVTSDDIEGRLPDEFLKLFTGKRYLALLPKVMDHLESWNTYYK